MPDHPAAHHIIALYEANATAFDRQRNRHLIEQDWLTRFIALLPASARVLDIGCGTGEPIARHLLMQGVDVTGVDASKAMIARCRQRMAHATWHAADMRTLDLGARFDGLLAWDSFFHLTPGDQRGMFAIFTRHAAPGAALMFTSGPRAGEAIGAWQGAELYHAGLDEDEYRRLLAAHGFDVVAHAAKDPGCGGHTVWLARVRC